MLVVYTTTSTPYRWRLGRQEHPRWGNPSITRCIAAPSFLGTIYRIKTNAFPSFHSLLKYTPPTRPMYTLPTCLSHSTCMNSDVRMYGVVR